MCAWITDDCTHDNMEMKLIVKAAVIHLYPKPVLQLL